jgi:hypothetical protein
VAGGEGQIDEMKPFLFLFYVLIILLYCITRDYRNIQMRSVAGARLPLADVACSHHPQLLTALMGV